MNADKHKPEVSPADPLGDEGRTSLMVVPPDDICSAADVYRKDCHAAAFGRIPAHMTVIYPYAPKEAWPDILPDLEKSASAIAPLDVRLARWKGGPLALCWLLEDPGPFMSMREQFMNVTPEELRPTHKFRPHLTIGWSTDSSLAAAWERVKNDPVDHSFHLDHVWLCAGGRGGYWEFVHRLDLGGER